jgi:Uma2 family endonuclease
MATAVRQLEGDAWLQIPATWGAYERLLRSKGDRYWPKYIYRDGELTIVSPSHTHEFFRRRLGEMIGDLFVELGIPYHPTGSVTLKAGPPRKKGVEGDDSFYLRDIQRVRKIKVFVMGVEPPPDLILEVVVSHPVEEALEVYASFGVPEVWVCGESGITFLVLGEGGSYQASASSACMPFLTSDELYPWVVAQEYPDEVAFRRAFREWVGTTLDPRLRPGARGPGVGPLE